MADKKAKAVVKKTAKVAPAKKAVAARKAASPKAASAKKTAEKKGKLVEIQTKETSASVAGFLNKLDSEQQRQDSAAIIEMMKKASGEEPKMWGSSIIGFGNMRYKSPATGREVDWMKVGFSPRKANLSLYVGVGSKAQQEALKKLGKFKTGKGCLYINKLSDVDEKVLKTMIENAMKGK